MGSPFEISDNVFYKLKMRLAWVMCEKAYLLDGIGYVREGEGEVL